MNTEIKCESTISEVTTGSRWTHKNKRMTYTVLFITNLRGNILAHPPDVVYLGDNGLVWSRPLTTWHESMLKN
jgi:hypothetical protein